ncbi:ABC transporter ATP-binding protein [Pseudomonas cremoricolorata]|uniref:ATP-binding cassette domain-containing protein n=1 Tax=Pseudomonas cremoricolorata TaxID=157783 RepID=UPI0006764CCC|nr:ABC transporter ATP-binding protein [Pseudomonas cremoricolorata]
MAFSKPVLLALGATLFLKVATVIPALVVADIIDNLSSASPPYELLGVFTCLIIVQVCLTPLQAWALARLCQARVKQLSSQWCRQLLDKHFEAYGQLHGGTLVKVLDRGITAQERWLNFLIGTAWPIMAETLVLIALFTYLGATIVLLGLVPLSLAYLWLNDRLVRWRRPHIEAVNAREDDLAEQWVDTFASATTVKLEQAEDAAMTPVRQTLARYADAAVQVACSGGCLQSLRILFIGAGSCGLLLWGMRDQASGSAHLTAGELVALFTLVSGLLAGVAQLAEAWRLLDQFRLDKRKLQAWLELPRFAQTQTASPRPASEASALRLMPCELRSRNELQLQVTQPLIIEKGERVALVGPSGCGKSTLLHVLSGTVDPLRKHVYLGDTCLEQLDGEQQLTALRLCTQRAHFIPGPLPRSVLFDQTHEQSQINDWLGALGLDASWYDLAFDARATSISGGEARRLTLLRILNRPGDFNLFDEPTSGLDGDSATRTWDLLFDTLNGRGLICVTHDQQALHRFDRVIQVEAGRIIAQTGAGYSSSSKL